MRARNLGDETVGMEPAEQPSDLARSSVFVWCEGRRYALETDPVIAGRQAAVNSLRKMGSGARKALPALRRYASTQQEAKPMPNKDEMLLELMESDLRNAVAELIRKLK